jgi:ribosomal protein S18 acetylase RimI-like enzyme
MIKIKLFKKEHVEEASKIFIKNYKKLRKKYRALPIRYEKMDMIISLLSKLIKKNPAAIAFSNNKIVGYLTGYTRIPKFKGNAFGVYIPEWAHSSMESNEKQIVYYTLYRFLADKWIGLGCRTHCISIFANDGILSKLLNNLCFGMLVIDGVKSLRTIKTEKAKGLVIRQITEKDLPEIQEIDRHFIDHLNASPVFLYRPAKKWNIENLKNEFMNDNVKTVVAVSGGKIIACARGKLNGGEGSHILRGNGTLGVDYAYTYPDKRKKGVATALLNELIKWGASNKMAYCTVDFESQNKEAVDFWLRYFRPVCFSLIRKVDERIVVKQ